MASSLTHKHLSTLKNQPLKFLKLVKSLSLFCLCLYFVDTKAAASSASQPAGEKTKKCNLEKEK